MIQSASGYYSISQGYYARITGIYHFTHVYTVQISSHPKSKPNPRPCQPYQSDSNFVKYYITLEMRDCDYVCVAFI